MSEFEYEFVNYPSEYNAQDCFAIESSYEHIDDCCICYDTASSDSEDSPSHAGNDSDFTKTVTVSEMEYNAKTSTTKQNVIVSVIADNDTPESYSTTEDITRQSDTKTQMYGNNLNLSPGELFSQYDAGRRITWGCIVSRPLQAQIRIKHPLSTTACFIQWADLNKPCYLLRRAVANQLGLDTRYIRLFLRRRLLSDAVPLKDYLFPKLDETGFQESEIVEIDCVVEYHSFCTSKPASNNLQ